MRPLSDRNADAHRFVARGVTTQSVNITRASARADHGGMTTNTDANLIAAGQRTVGLSPYAVRVALFYAALFLIYGVHVPYLPVWLDWRGLTAGEVAAITASPFLLRLIVTPAAAVLADRIANHRLVIIGLAWVALALAVVLSQASGFWPIFLCAVPFALVVATIMPLTETVAVHGVKSSGLDYGRMRVWGSLAFIAVGLVAGALVDQNGPSVSLWLLVAGSIATVAAAHALPRPSPAIIAATPAVSAPRALLGPEVQRLIRSPLFLAFIVAASFTQAAHALFYTFGALHWQSQGISASWVGVLWSLGVMSEVMLFAYAGAIVQRISAAGLLLAGAAAGIVRWSLMSFDPPLELLIPLQLLHAISFGATHLGAIQFISKAVPEAASGTAQALYATFAAGVVMGAATLACGSLYKAHSGDAYLAMALLSAVSLAASLYVTKRWDRGVL